MDDDAFFEAFTRGDIEPALFDHRAHLRAAVCALGRMPFLEACIALRDGLGLLATKAGKPDLYNETLTVAFVALIADALEERGTAGSGTASLDALVTIRPDLLDRRTVTRWYDDATLASPSARKRFRLPAAVRAPARAST